MRALWLAIGLSCVSLAPALACDFHEGGGFGRYAQYSGYESYEEMKAREARLLAEREQAMNAARQSFLARFDIKPDDAVKLAAASIDPQAPSANADRSPKPDPQAR